MNSPVFRLCALGFVVLFLFGCGGSKTGVSGTVTLDSQPLSDAEVEFFSLDRDKHIGGGVTRTDAQGKYSLQSGPQLTLKPGKYGVYVSKWVDRKTKKAPPPEDMEMQKLGGLLYNVVPPKYSNREEAPNLTYEIKSGSNTNANFDLKSK